MTDQRLPLAGKGAVVTGGGRGIGAAVARQLAEAGAAVVVAARSGDQLQEIVSELTRAGHRAWAETCDVTDENQVQDLERRASAHLGQVDILINNAGIASSAPIAGTKLDEWNRIFAVNSTGVFLCTRAFLPAMTQAGWGRVVTVASVVGKVGAPYIAAYAASKHAAIGFTRAAAAEVATKGVTVNAVCPGYVDTEMTIESVDRIVGKTGSSPEHARQLLENLSPQKRLFSAEEVAFQVISLCHPLAGGVTGQAIVLDGGGIQS